MGLRQVSKMAHAISAVTTICLSLSSLIFIDFSSHYQFVRTSGGSVRHNSVSAFRATYARRFADINVKGDSPTPTPKAFANSSPGFFTLGHEAAHRVSEL